MRTDFEKAIVKKDKGLALADCSRIESMHNASVAKMREMQKGSSLAQIWIRAPGHDQQVACHPKLSLNVWSTQKPA